MTNLSPNMNVLNKLLGHVLRNVDPIVLLVLNRWSDSWKQARISGAKIGADVQLLEDIKNAKSQLINDITRNMSQIITKTQADELKSDSYAIGSDNVWNAIELQIKRRMTSLIAIVKYAANELETWWMSPITTLTQSGLAAGSMVLRMWMYHPKNCKNYGEKSLQDKLNHLDKHHCIHSRSLEI